MVVYLARRVVQAIVVILIVSALVFFISHLAGDPAVLMAPVGASVQEINDLRHQYGFDRPVIVQYLDFLKGAAKGDFGMSLRHQQPAMSMIAKTLPNTIELALAAQFLALLVAIPAGIFAATRRNSLFDTLTMTAAVLGQSIPVFWLGLMLILVFGVSLHVLPISGMGGWKHLVLPAVTLSMYSMARTSRLVRSSMLEVLTQEYVTTARAKGLPEWVVLWQHALKNAFIPVVTVVSLDFGLLLGGAVITETIFAWPGIGRLMINAINTRDFPLIQACVLTISVIFVLINQIVDVVYTYLDPRIKYVGDTSRG